MGRRRLAPLLAGALILVSCAGRHGDAARTEKFCRAFATMSATAAKAARDTGLRADLERDAAAALKALPDDAPDAVKDYLGTVRELSALSQVSENPQTGGIKAEYVDDFQRLVRMEGATKNATSQFVAERCQGAPVPAKGSQGGTGGTSGSSSGRPNGQAPSRPAEVRVLLADGPAGSYERVTVDVGKVTATNADPRAAGGANPMASAANSLLVDIDLAATTGAANRFGAGDFRLVGPDAPPIIASALLDPAGEASTVRLNGSDAARRTVVFPTPELVRDARSYALRIERDDRVPAVLAFGGGTPAGYPVALTAGAAGAFAVQLTPVCTDRYRTAVRSASADLDADLGGTTGIGRAHRGRRWVTVVLQVTNVTPATPGSGGPCQAFSGSAGVVELHLQADGGANVAANARSFDKLAVGASADRVYVFEVNAGARSFVLTGNAGEVLGRWTTELPPTPGE